MTYLPGEIVIWWRIAPGVAGPAVAVVQRHNEDVLEVVEAEHLDCVVKIHLSSFDENHRPRVVGRLRLGQPEWR